jgi:hypothetical protein
MFNPNAHPEEFIDLVPLEELVVPLLPNGLSGDILLSVTYPPNFSNPASSAPCSPLIR